MGTGIAQVAAAAGHPVTILDQNADALLRGEAMLAEALETAVRKGRIDEAGRRAILDRIVWSSDLALAERKMLIIEAIVEDLEEKRRLVAAIARVARADAIIATNTSSLGIDDIALLIGQRERFLGLHFFNPVPAMKLVEIVAGEATAPEVIDEASRLMRLWGKEPVRVRDVPGFIVNRVARPYYAEGFLALGDKIGAAEVDAALTDTGGFRMGPLRLADLIGHDVNFAVASSVFAADVGTSRFRPQEAQAELVRAGRFGRKAGRGIYDYDAALPDAVYDGPGAPPKRLAFSDSGLLEPLVSAAIALGLDISLDNALPKDALEVGGTIVALGDGRTLSQRTDADVLLDYARDFATAGTLMITVSDPAHAARARGLFTAIGKRSINIPDRPGQIVLRTLAQIANAAADTVADRIASDEDVDIALRFGANHPEGPLGWARRVGIHRVRTALANIAEATGDTLYAPSRLFDLVES